MEASLFKFFSFGKVAANKPLYDKEGQPNHMVEVFPIESFTMSAGELTDNVDEIDIKGKDASGQDYQSKIKTKASITCKWIPLHEPNRITPPDVRRNEQVMIYRYGDTEFYFWTTAFNDVIRKLETAVWWFSGTPEDGKNAETVKTADNGYFIEISTHEKHVVFSTSKKNGEVVRYYLQFDTGNGNFVLKDDLGQEVVFYSVEGKIEVTSEQEIVTNTKKHTNNCEEYIVNASKSVLINTKAYKLVATDTIDMNTKDYTHQASGTVKYTTPQATFTGKTNVLGMFTFSAGMTGSSSGGSGGGATMQIQGNANYSGDVVANGKSLVGHVHTARGANAPTSPPN